MTAGLDHSTVLLVNSTDRYADCWAPFFTLLQAYWPDCPYPIVLNSETRAYEHPGLAITCSLVAQDLGSARLTWSESLIRCLDGLDADFVLYLQEDYFLNAPVDAAMISHFVEIMAAEDLTHLRLMELGGNEPYRALERHPLLWQLSPRGNYLVSLQAGLWHRHRLRNLLRANESAWQFERWGTLRARQEAAGFWCPNLDAFNRQGRLIVSYTPTGVVRGKWFGPAVVDLFNRHGIVVDYSKRGFYRPGYAAKAAQRLRTRARRLLMRYAP